MNEIYVSTDIESDGPIPGGNNMLSFGSAAFTLEKELLDTFQANLDLLDMATPDPNTMTNFWDKNPEAWAACRTNTQNPAIAMHNYLKWLKKLPGKPVFVGYPATFDFMFVAWYLNFFTGENPFGFQGCDVKSYVMGMKRFKTFKGTVKKKFDKKWREKGIPHNHVALTDAIEQGALFINILRDNLELPPKELVNKTTDLETLLASR